jgi:hypothetical protein
VGVRGQSHLRRGIAAVVIDNIIIIIIIINFLEVWLCIVIGTFKFVRV